MDSVIEETLEGLRKRHIIGSFAQTPEDASQKILDLISPDAIVGVAIRPLSVN